MAKNSSVEQEVVLTGRDRENALVLAALSELLRVIDESLAAGNLSFPAAFSVACDGIAPQFPFLESSRAALVYKDGEIRLNADAETDLVLCAVFAALRPIFRRLRSEVKYSGLLAIVSDRLLEISAERRIEFVNLGLMRHLEDLLADE